MPNANAKFVWNGEKLIGEIERAAEVGLTKAAAVLQLKIQTNISVVGPPHSLPGEAPHLITGNLQGSVKVASGRNRLEKRVTVGAPYALDLEFGNSRIEPRPFMYRSLVECKDELAAVVVDEIRQQTGADVSVSVEVSR